MDREFEVDPVDLPRLHYSSLAAVPFEVFIVVPPSVIICGNVVEQALRELNNKDILFSSLATQSRSNVVLDSTVMVARNNLRVHEFLKLWGLLYLEDCVVKLRFTSDACALKLSLATAPMLRYAVLSQQLAVRYVPGTAKPTEVDSTIVYEIPPKPVVNQITGTQISQQPFKTSLSFSMCAASKDTPLPDQGSTGNTGGIAPQPPPPAAPKEPVRPAFERTYIVAPGVKGEQFSFC
jgi:hypothetical protein